MLDAVAYSRHPNARKIPPERGAEWGPRATWQNVAVFVEDAVTAATAPVELGVRVMVNHGRWVVACPDCSGAQLACSSDHRFLCNECANLAIEGLWRPALWPEAAVEISEELESRELTANRNWLPGETLEDLRAEAAAAAAPLPGPDLIVDELTEQNPIDELEG